MSSNHYFVIVGTQDNPLYEVETGPLSRGEGKKEENRHMNQFIIHSALDVVEEVMWGTNSLYLKVIDKFNEWFVSAYITVGGIKFMMLHDNRNEDSIRSFFVDCHELYLKTLLNPFYQVNSPINSVAFDSKVKALLKKYLSN